MKELRVALVHDWLTGMRGGEYVLEAIAELFPKAELFTLIAIPGSVSPTIQALPLHTSWLQWIPGARRRYRHLLPLMPRAIESLDLSRFDLVISSSHCVAKGVRKAPGAVHVSYVHAPMRYMWDRFDDYFGPGRASWLTRAVAARLRPRMQSWDRDVSSRERVDLLAANSRYIAECIHSVYGRNARVVNPFVNLTRFKRPEPEASRNAAVSKSRRSYAMLGAFAPYKRVDLAIEAFNRLKLPLIVGGGGQDEAKLRPLAGPTIQFLGSLSNAKVAEIFSASKALIFPGKEDFGITPLEAMASGIPVIAFGEGGILDSVTPQTGLLFKEQSVASLCEAVLKLERGEASFDPAACRARAEHFSKGRFQREFLNAVREAWSLAGKGAEGLAAAVKPPPS